MHKKVCEKNVNRLPKIIDPLRIEVHIVSESFGEEIFIYNEHYMKFSKMMKGKLLLAFLFKTLRKDRWFRNNKFVIEEKINEHHVLIKRPHNAEIELTTFENREFIHKMSQKSYENSFEDEFRDLLRLSVLQELKFNFYKLGALLVDILKEQHTSIIKYIIVFNFP